MTIRVVDLGVLVHWFLTGHQRLDLAMHEGSHQPRAGETPLLQRLDRRQQVSYFGFESRPCTALPLIRGHRLMTSE